MEAAISGKMMEEHPFSQHHPEPAGEDMQRNQTTLTLSVPQDTKEKLIQLAERLDLWWGEKPSPSKLVAAIAEGKVSVGTAAAPSPEQVAALLSAVSTLRKEGGESTLAGALAQLVISRGGLPDDVLRQLNDELAREVIPWRANLEQAISDRQPVLITYRGSKPEVSTYLARYVELRNRMGHWYADIRTADGVANSTDIPELHENRCLRLDRILSVAPALHPLGWASEGLATAIADLTFSGNEAEIYKPHADDLGAETPLQEVGGKKIRRVRRKVHSSWWFVRDVLWYGPALVVEGPPELIERVKQRLVGMLERYEPNLGA